MEAVIVTLAQLALNKIIEGGAGELGKGLTTGTMAKVNKLGEMIWNRIKYKMYCRVGNAHRMGFELF